jgi:signal transduction histidine kinase/CheY-like chemotaxis protein
MEFNITKPFEKIRDQLHQLKKNMQIFTEGPDMTDEIVKIEKSFTTALNTLQNYHKLYTGHIDLFSGLIDFQSKLGRSKSAPEVTKHLFTFIKNNIDFNHAFILLKLGELEQRYELIPDDHSKINFYKKFLSEDNVKIIKEVILSRELALLLDNINKDLREKIDWSPLLSQSAIIFPIRIRDQVLGFGLLSRQAGSFLLKDLSLINLINGLISLSIFQYFYISKLKSKLFKQFKMQKNYEEFKYSKFFKKSPLFIFTLNSQGDIIHSNGKNLSKLDLNEEFVIGENFFNLLPLEHRRPLQNIVSQMEEGSINFYQCPIKVSEHKEVFMEFYLTKMKIQESYPLSIIFAVDATQQYYKNLQSNRNEILDEITHFSIIINGYLDNLLAVLIPNIDLLKTKVEPTEQTKRIFRALDTSLGQTSRLVQKFLNYDLDDIENATSINLNETILSIINERQINIMDGVELNYALDPATPNLMIYPKRCKRLINILIQNAIEALPGRGYIKVSTRFLDMKNEGLVKPHSFYLRKGKYVELTVEDNGMGIDERVLPQIFKPFFSTKIRNEGVGLGLYIAYNIVKDMEGQIFVESRSGKSTTFFVYIPYKDESEIQQILPGMEEVVKEKAPTLLIVDDEYNIRSMLKEVFEMNGYSVYTAANGQEGVDIFREHLQEIDLVILDMVMPIMDGKKAFYEIKKIKDDQKVIIISGYAQREDLQEILRKGALGFMSKPFQIDAIVTKVKECLNGKNPDK